MVRILVSKYSKDANSRNALSIGDTAIFTGKDLIPISVVIKSDIMRHDKAPSDGLGYECLFSDTGEVAFASADNLKLSPLGQEK